MITLFNHENSPVWTEKNQRLNQQNGAKTYSEAITNWYWPIFQRQFQARDEKVALVTVTAENQAVSFPGYDRIFIFLHECTASRQPVIARAKKIIAANRKARVTFVVWNEDTAKLMIRQQIDAIFLPMAIDVHSLDRYRNPNQHKFNKRIIYYGQIRAVKRPYVTYLISKAHELGWEVDYISDNRLNGDSWKMSRQQVFELIQQYKYGAGVGICAAEMAALGLKVFLYAYNFKANCPYTEEQARYYVRNNLCSHEETNVLIPDVIKNIDKLVPLHPVDVRDNANYLQKLLENQ